MSIFQVVYQHFRILPLDGRSKQWSPKLPCQFLPRQMCIQNHSKTFTASSWQLNLRLNRTTPIWSISFRHVEAMAVALQDQCSSREHGSTMNISWYWGDMRTLSSPRFCTILYRQSGWGVRCSVFCTGSCFFLQPIHLSTNGDFLQSSKVILRFLTPIGDGEPRGDSGQLIDNAGLSQ